MPLPEPADLLDEWEAHHGDESFDVRAPIEEVFDGDPLATDYARRVLETVSNSGKGVHTTAAGVGLPADRKAEIEAWVPRYWKEAADRYGL